MPHSDPGESTRIDPRNVSIVLQALWRLLFCRGEIRSDSSELWQLWLTADHRNQSEVSSLEMRRALQEIRILKDTMHTLSVLTKNLEATIERRREEVLLATRHYGLLSLPNEIIVLIFRQILYSNDECVWRFFTSRYIICSLSLVCQHFRKMVLAFTEVWSYLDLYAKHSEESLDIFLSRSKNEPLSMSLLYGEHTKKNFNRVLSHKQRLVIFKVSFSADDGILEEHRDLVFPSVRSLCFQSSYRDSAQEDIFSRWSFPNVEHVELLSALPKPATFIGHGRLMSFKYKAVTTLQGEETIFAAITNFLRLAVTLRVLDLDVADLLYNTPVTALAVELPNVTDFSLSNWRVYSIEDPPMSLQDFAKIANLFKLPKVQKLSVSMAFFERDFLLGQWLKQAFPHPQVSRTVSELTFKVMWFREDWISPRRLLKLNDFLEHFTAVRSLTLNAPFCHIRLKEPEENEEEDEVGGWLTELRSLNLEDYDGSFEDTRNLFIDLYFATMDLETITVHSKHILDQSVLARFVHEADLQIRNIPPEDDI